MTAGAGDVVPGPQEGRRGDSGPRVDEGASQRENGSEGVPMVTVFGQLRSGEIHEFGTADGDSAQDVMDALADLLRACADEIPEIIVDREVGPDAARWAPEPDDSP